MDTSRAIVILIVDTREKRERESWESWIYIYVYISLYYVFRSPELIPLRFLRVSTCF